MGPAKGLVMRGVHHPVVDRNKAKGLQKLYGMGNALRLGAKKRRLDLLEFFFTRTLDDVFHCKEIYA